MRKLTRIGLTICACALAGCAATKQAPAPVAAPPATTAVAPPALPSGTVGESTVTQTATVQKVNMKTRHVTLKDEDGKIVTIVAGEEVRNLKQVKRGDVLRITYHEAMAYQVSKAGTSKPRASTSTEMSHAALGDMPAASVKNVVSVRMTIAEINKATAEVSLRDPKGRVSVYKVKDPSKLDHVSVGDVVDITYTEALAIAVEKPKK